MNDYNQYPDNDYRYYLEHGTKGLHWKWPDHKYIDIINGRYIYPAKKAVGNAISSITSGQIVRDAVSTVKGVYKSAKTGGIRGAKGFLETESKRKKNNRTNAANTGSSDYAESDRINKKALKKDAKAKAKAKAKADKAAAKAKAKADKKEAKRRSKPHYLLDNSLGTRLSSTLRRAARSVKNLPDVLNQRIRAKNQRKEAKAKLPTQAERERMLKKARKDIQTKVNVSKKQKEISRRIYRKTGKRVDPSKVDIYNDHFLENLWDKIKVSRGTYQPKGGS